MNDILTMIPRDRHKIFIDPKAQTLNVVIYPEVEEKSRLVKAHTIILRESLQKKGFRMDPIVRHRGDQVVEIERWVYPTHGANSGILMFVPGFCRVHFCRYVSSDPNDTLLRDCPGSILKVGDGCYRIYRRAEEVAV